MNPSQLLAQFDLISDAPDAIPRLRRFVLDLAVRGKLVAEDPKDEPVSDLLKRLQTEKMRQEKAGAIRRQGILPVIEPEAVPFDVPRSWQWIRVGDAFLYDAGTKCGPNELLEDRWLLELEDIEKDTSVVLTRLTVRDRNSRSTKSEFRAGDILYGKLRPYLNKVLVASEPGYSTTEIVAIRPFAPLCGQYCCVAFRRPDFVAYVGRVGQGTKMPRLRTSDALAALFPLPPLPEQYRIVAKVDELMALCDRLETAQTERESRRDRLVAASLHRLSQPTGAATTEGFRDHARFHLRHLPSLTTRPEHIQQVRQTILNLAVCGRLVPQDPGERSVAIDLAECDRARQETAMEDRRADRDSQAMLAVEDRWAAPLSWEWRGLADLVLFIDYRGTTPQKARHGVRLITAKNVRKGFINLSPEEYLTEPNYRSWMTRGLPKAGDVLFTTEAPMGNAAVVRLVDRFGLAQRVICFRPYGALNPDFLVLQLLAAPFQAILGKTATGLTAKGIKAAKLKRLPVVVPPLAEQHRIVAKVEELVTVCDQLEAQLTAALAEGHRLLEAVLSEALSRVA